ncbi:MAG TPA: hypothetical protein VMS78_08365 [Rhizomicrobium sp.]|nr:hypothetical protein [Rhizomicrobium sp.]
MNSDDPKPSWFRERTFGYGYGPASWQGWLVTAIFLILVIGTPKLAEHLILLYHLGHDWYFAIVALILAYTAAFLGIIYIHRGPS